MQSYQAATAISHGDGFFGRSLLVFVFYAVAFNYALSFLSNVVSFGVSLRSTSRFGVNAAAYLEAIKQIAGAESIDSLSRLKMAIDVVKVAGALEEMDTFLKEKAASADASSGSNSTIASLAVYLALNKAREQFNFQPSDYGLTEDDAIDIARMFSKYDANDDFKLDINELERLCADANRPLTRDEAKVVFKVMDEDGNGYIDFPEFVSFWTNPTRKVEMLKEELAEQSDATGEEQLVSKSS